MGLRILAAGEVSERVAAGGLGEGMKRTSLAYQRQKQVPTKAKTATEHKQDSSLDNVPPPQQQDVPVYINCAFIESVFECQVVLYAYIGTIHNKHQQNRFCKSRVYFGTATVYDTTKAQAREGYKSRATDRSPAAKKDCYVNRVSIVVSDVSVRRNRFADSSNRTSHVTLMDVCRAAGVSKATVSNVINNRPGVGSELREKIQSLMKQMGYVPRPAARHLSLSRTDTLAVVFIDLTAGWLLSIYRGILHRAAEAKYHVTTALSTRLGDEFELPTHVLGTASVDGLIWMDTRVTPELIDKFRKHQSMPFVVIQCHVDDPDITTVCIENTQGAYQAMKHLLSLGYRRIMLMTSQADNPDSQQRMSGAQQALREFKVTVRPPYILNGQNIRRYAYEQLTAFLKSKRKLPEAIFAFNDDMAIGIFHCLKDHGIRVPEDIALVGFDGIDEARDLQLTTIETPVHEMGVMATQLLIDLIQKPPSERRGQHVTIGGALRIRKTCGAHLQQAPPPLHQP